MLHQIHYQLPNDHQPHHHQLDQLDQPDEESHQLHHESDHQEESEIEEEYDLEATAAVHVRLAAETELLKSSHESNSSIQYGW